MIELTDPKWSELNSDSSDLAPIPAEFEAEWHASAKAAIPLLAELLAEPHSEEHELCCLLSSLAAFNGCRSIARALEALDSDTEWGE